MFLVVDTGTVLLNGISLRSWTLDFSDEQGLPSGHAINVTERLGMQYGLEIMPWNCNISELGESLVCYSDNELSYNSPSWPHGCTSVVGQEEFSSSLSVDAYPNPGTTHFTLSLPPGPHTIILFDATGRMVFEQRTAEERPVIGTEGLPSGIYTVRMVNGNGTMHRHQWIKS
jgi:hypothetical protein